MNKKAEILTGQVEDREIKRLYEFRKESESHCRDITPKTVKIA
jgi:hypothetical protein